MYNIVMFICLLNHKKPAFLRLGRVNDLTIKMKMYYPKYFLHKGLDRGNITWKDSVKRQIRDQEKKGIEKWLIKD